MTGQIPKRIKTRIRQLIALEMRSRLTEIPEHLEAEPQDVIDAWPDYVSDIADQISPPHSQPYNEDRT